MLTGDVERTKSYETGKTFVRTQGCRSLVRVSHFAQVEWIS